MEDMKKFSIDDDIMYMFSLANMNLHEVQFWPCQGTPLFHKNVYQTWIQDVNVMIWKQQYYTRYMKISQVYYFLCHVLNNKTREDICFFTSI